VARRGSRRGVLRVRRRGQAVGAWPAAGRAVRYPLPRRGGPLPAYRARAARRDAGFVGVLAARRRRTVEFDHPARQPGGRIRHLNREALARWLTGRRWAILFTRGFASTGGSRSSFFGLWFFPFSSRPVWALRFVSAPPTNRLPPSFAMPRRIK